MDNNKFLALTKKMLKKDAKEDLFSKNGFIAKFGSEKECALFLGLNPAGNEENVKHESNKIYLNYIPEVKPKKEASKYFNNSYFGAIYKFMLKIVGDKFKWSWCNYDYEEIEKNIINNEELENYKNEIFNYYNAHKNKEYNLLIGDLYYYHTTDSGKLNDLIEKNNKYENIKEMVNCHIDVILENKKTLKFIYVNNAKASKDIAKALTGKENVNDSYIEYEYKNEKIKIFLGGMLSGQHAMDIYSRNRLENEIKKYMKLQ